MKPRSYLNPQMVLKQLSGIMQLTTNSLMELMLKLTEENTSQKTMEEYMATTTGIPTLTGKLKLIRTMKAGEMLKLMKQYRMDLFLKRRSWMEVSLLLQQMEA